MESSAGEVRADASQPRDHEQFISYARDEAVADAAKYDHITLDYSIGQSSRSMRSSVSCTRII